MFTDVLRVAYCTSVHCDTDTGPRSADEVMVPPFMNQMTVSLVVRLRHRMSPSVSPLKSPVAAMNQLFGMADRNFKRPSGPRLLTTCG